MFRIAVLVGIILTAVPHVARVAVAVPAREAARTEAVPEPLKAMESAAEDAYDHALAGSRAVVDDVANLRESWQTYRANAERAGASRALIASVDAAVADLANLVSSGASRTRVARDANRISAQMEPLFRRYHPQTPPELMTLDYLGRAVVLDASDNDLTAARADVDRLDARWRDLRPRVVHAGAQQLATRYDREIAVIRQAIGDGNASETRAAAHANLELVDALEAAFTPHSKPGATGKSR